jgi:hypothetical protein
MNMLKGLIETAGDLDAIFSRLVVILTRFYCKKAGENSQSEAGTVAIKSEAIYRFRLRAIAFGLLQREKPVSQEEKHENDKEIRMLHEMHWYEWVIIGGIIALTLAVKLPVYLKMIGREKKGDRKNGPLPEKNDPQKG